MDEPPEEEANDNIWWELQRRPKGSTGRWEYVEDYQKESAVRDRLAFKRTGGWDHRMNEFRVIRVERIETVEDW